MVVKSFQILGDAHPDEFPLQPKKHSLEYLREIAHLRPRTNTFSAVLRVRHAMTFAIHEFFNNNGFYNIHTPLITATDAEGEASVDDQVNSFFRASGKKDPPDKDKDKDVEKTKEGKKATKKEKQKALRAEKKKAKKDADLLAKGAKGTDSSKGKGKGKGKSTWKKGDPAIDKGKGKNAKGKGKSSKTYGPKGAGSDWLGKKGKVRAKALEHWGTARAKVQATILGFLTTEPRRQSTGKGKQK